jgi:hypothetical protein
MQLAPRHCNDTILTSLITVFCSLVAAANFLYRLNLSGVYNAYGLSQLPAAQLQQLHLFVGGAGGGIYPSSNPYGCQQLPLGHLTALTFLDCNE